MTNHLLNKSLRLMAGRVNLLDSESNLPNEQDKFVGMDILRQQLVHLGGYPQQDRMIRSKRRTLDKAVLYSYQGAFVKKIDSFDNEEPVRALINPNKLKQDYDDKIISVGFEYGFQVGDVFEWCNTNTHWLIYLQDLTELAYFRGDIRRCRYEISWQDEDGIHNTYAAVRGPVETKIDYIQKHGISVDNPNLSLNILMPLTEETKKYFQRYSKFYLQNDSVCWRVEAFDWISTPGILEIAAVEYYANETEDDIENGIVGALAIKDTDVNTARVERLIDGETFIKPKRQYTYTYTGFNNSEYTWELDKKLPVEYTVDGNSITLKWVASYSGQFDLHFAGLTKTVVVESLF